MSSYNPFEKSIASILSGLPEVKKNIKKLYTSVNYYINRKGYQFRSEYMMFPILSDDKNESFFGYYDKSPVNSSGEFLIFHETEGICTHNPPYPAEKLNIMLFDKRNNSYEKIAETSSYNWQQGSKLQWLTDSKFIFNDFNGSKFISKIYDMENKASISIDFPIYDCYKYEFALSLNFLRLNSTDKDYGYKNIKNKPELNELKNDGVFFVDLKRNTSRLIISLEMVIDLHFKDNMKDAEHLINHIMISPDGRSFIFIHRWYQAGKRHDSLILSNITGTEIKVLADDDFVSHCCWYDNETVAGYLRDKSCGNSFYKINIISGKTELLSDKLKTFGDGHPTFFRNKMLFDSYPDRSRMQHLYIYDIEIDEVNDIGSFLSPLKFFAETRCDLHPRWSSDGKSIYFDSTHEGKRILYMINL